MRQAVRAELDSHMKQAEERNKALREKENQLSENDDRIKELEKSRRCEALPPHASRGDVSLASCFLRITHASGSHAHTR